ncbi:unnamed protein product [Bathycoccus prasinos]
MSQPHHMKRFGVDGDSQKEGETTKKKKKKNLTLKTKRQREKEFHSETTNEFKRRRRSKREEEDEKSDEEDESMRFKYSMSQFASQQNQQKKVEVICEVCGNSGLENFEEDFGSYFCKKCNAKTDALVVAPDAEALARALPGFGGEQGPMSFHGARRRRVGFGHRVHDYSQQFTKEERMMEEKRALRIEERKFTKLVDLHCETMTKLLRAQCEFCVERYVEASNGDKDETEREKRRREKRANEFRKACRSIWFALLAAKDELFSIDMDDIGSVNDALRTSTFVMSARKLRKERRKAIADAKRQKEMLAYSDDDDDGDEGGGELEQEEEIIEDERGDEDDVNEEDDNDAGEDYQEDEDDDAEDVDGRKDKNGKSLRMEAEEERQHLNAVNSLIMAHLPQKLTLGVLFVATRMCFADEESFGFTFARDISTLASTGKLPYLRPTTNIYNMRAWGKDLLRPRTMPTSTDVIQVAEYIVAKTGLREDIVFERNVFNPTRELVRRAFQSSFPAFLHQQPHKPAEAVVVARNDENVNTNTDDDNSESKAVKKKTQSPLLSRVADAYCESAENLMQFLGYDFLLDKEKYKFEAGQIPQISRMKEADARKMLSTYPAEVHASAIIVVTLKLLFGLDGRVKSLQRKRTASNHVPDCFPVDERENSVLKAPADGWLVWATNARKAFQEELLRKRRAIPPILAKDKRKDDAKDVNAYIDWCEANVFDDATKKLSGRFNIVRDKLCKMAAGKSAAKIGKDYRDDDNNDGALTSLSQLLKEEKKRTENKGDDDDNLKADAGAKLYEVYVDVPFTKGESDRASAAAVAHADGNIGFKHAGSFVHTYSRIDLNAPEYIAVLNWASEVCGANFKTAHRCVMIMEMLLLLEDNKFANHIKNTWNVAPRSVLKEREEKTAMTTTTIGKKAKKAKKKEKKNKNKKSAAASPNPPPPPSLIRRSPRLKRSSK